AAEPRGAKEPAPAGTAPRPGAAAADAKPKEARRSWSPEGMTARGDVVAAVRAQTASGEQRVTLEGDALDHGREAGGRLWSGGGGGGGGGGGSPGGGGGEGWVVAPSIGFRFARDERSLWTDGRTRAVVWTGTGASPAAKAPRAPAGIERFGARSETKIEIAG